MTFQKLTPMPIFAMHQIIMPNAIMIFAGSESGDFDLATVRSENSRHHFYRRRFSGPVRPDKADNPPFGDVETDVVHSVNRFILRAKKVHERSFESRFVKLTSVSFVQVSNGNYIHTRPISVRVCYPCLILLR